jgi:acetolactate synthase-1/3 small subunit
MEDHPGVLNRVVNLFRRRGFNIDSLTVGHTEARDISRMTLVVNGSDHVVEQVVKQLYKVVDVLKVSDVTEEKTVVRELALLKVNTTPSTRSEIMQIVDIYRAKIVDVAQDSIVVEVTGEEEKIDSLYELVKRFGVREMARTGRVVMTRGSTGKLAVGSDNGKEP